MKLNMLVVLLFACACSGVEFANPSDEEPAVVVNQYTQDVEINLNSAFGVGSATNIHLTLFVVHNDQPVFSRSYPDHTQVVVINDLEFGSYTYEVSLKDENNQDRIFTGSIEVSAQTRAVTVTHNAAARVKDNEPERLVSATEAPATPSATPPANLFLSLRNPGWGPASIIERCMYVHIYNRQLVAPCSSYQIQASTANMCEFSLNRNLDTFLDPSRTFFRFPIALQINESVPDQEGNSVREIAATHRANGSVWVFLFKQEGALVGELRCNANTRDLTWELFHKLFMPQFGEVVVSDQKGGVRQLSSFVSAHDWQTTPIDKLDLAGILPR